MQVAPGEIFGLLGPNGAGKSTLVKIIMTIVRANKANGTVLGKPIGHKATLTKVGYLPEDHRFPDYLTGRQVLEYYAALSGVKRRVRRRRATELLDVVGMSDWGKTRVKKYSKGMMQRVGLAQALMNDPTLVLLDEPTDGVDPVGRRDIRDVLTRLKDEGRTVFINSHLLSEVEMICDRVAILVKGEMRTQGTVADLTRDSIRHEIEYIGQPPDPTTQADWFEKVSVRTPENNRIILSLPDHEPEAIQPIIDHLRKQETTILRVELKTESLEDMFIRAVEQDQSSPDSLKKRTRKGRSS